MGAMMKSESVIGSGRLVEQYGGPAIVGLYEASKVIGAATDIERGLRDLVNMLPIFWGVARVTVTLRGRTDELFVAASSWVSPELVKRGQVPVLRELVTPVLSFGSPMVVPDIKADPLYQSALTSVSIPDHYRLGLIGVPIKAGGIPIGVLGVERLYQPFDTVNFESDVRVMSVVASLIGQAVCADNRRLTGDAEEGNRREERAKPVAACVATAVRPIQRPPRPCKPAPYQIENVIGMSQRMQDVFAELHKAAPTNTTVLLRGDSGTGKEMLARAVHYLSGRRSQPFIKVNCAALSESLLESELFGHERGAFTGAQAERKGRFELAHGGTLFLDEIGEISPAFQSKLLRVLQEGEFERVGGTRTLKTDVRLVAATNRNLEDAVVEGKFRADLYYRLNVVPIFLPPLRERREDISPLVDHFVKKFNEENRRSLRFSAPALRVMTEECQFPGNVRELENCIRRVCTMARSEVVELPDFPCRRGQCATPLMARRTLGHRDSGPPPLATLRAPPDTVDLVEDDGDGLLDSPGMRDQLVEAMDKTGWVQAKAARLLGLTPRQIGYALRKHRIELKRL